MFDLWVTTALEVLEVPADHWLMATVSTPFWYGSNEKGWKFYHRLTPAVLVWIERCLERVSTNLPSVGPDDRKSYQAARAVATELAADVTVRYGKDAIRAARAAPTVRLPEPDDLGLPLGIVTDVPRVTVLTSGNGICPYNHDRLWQSLDWPDVVRCGDCHPPVNEGRVRWLSLAERPTEKIEVSGNGHSSRMSPA